MAAGLLDLRQFLQPLAHILTPARSIGIASWTVRTVHSQQGQQATDPTPRVQFPPRTFARKPSESPKENDSPRLSPREPLRVNRWEMVRSLRLHSEISAIFINIYSDSLPRAKRTRNA